MKALVAVKRVIASSVKANVKSDESGVITQNVKMAMNDFDEVAVEQAIRLKEAGIVSEVIVLSIGTGKSQEVIRHGLALGADRGILVKTDQETEPLAVAHTLKHYVNEEEPSIVLTGKQAIDNDASQMPAMLAGMLGWSQATSISGLEIEDKKARVTREIDQGLQYLSFDLPAVISVDLRLNTPRYANMPAIMKAKRKPLKTIDAQQLGIDFTPQLKTLKVTEPPSRGQGVMVNNAEELVDKLVKEGAI